MKLIILLNLITVISCECDTYFSCLNSFIGNFFSANSFEPSEIRDDSSDFVDFGKDNINKILSGVAGFLRDEVNATLDLDTEYHSFINDNGRKIFVKTFVINGSPSDFDLQDEIFDNAPVTPINANTQIIQNIETSTVKNLISNENAPIKNIQNSIKQSPKNIEDNEIPDEDYYSDDNSTDYTVIDYIELYKDTTNEYVEYTTESQIIDKDNIKMKSHAGNNRNKMNYLTDSCPGGTSDDVTTVFSWIAAIFIKNDTDQYQYYCDGAILSTNIIVTPARCVKFTRAEDIIVILGKTSLRESQNTERMIKIKELIVHENFTDTSNDIAILETENPIEITNTISIACLSDGDVYTDAVTTGWAVSGNLTAINFDMAKSEQCTTQSNICGVYKNDITTCPSFGGVYATKGNGWYLRGIRSEDTSDRSICVHKPVYYTPLDQYAGWIGEYV